jgi:hypothetical protein
VSGEDRGIGMFERDVDPVGDVIPRGECGGEPGCDPDMEVKNGRGARATSSSSVCAVPIVKREDVEERVGLDALVDDEPMEIQLKRQYDMHTSFSKINYSLDKLLALW